MNVFDDFEDADEEPTKREVTAEHAPAPPTARQIPIIFQLESAEAHEAMVAGDFTDWEKHPIPMQRMARGGWVARVLLSPGRHQYRFVIDGQWKNDPHCDEHFPNDYGTLNDVIRV